jgi:phage terminase large subunit-like protein
VAVRQKRVTRSARNIAWIETYCRVPEGKLVGQPVKLRDWQRRELRKLYDSPTRLLILSFGRKNGKTALIAFLVLLHTCGPEATPNSEVVSGARSRDQAAMVFRYASKCVRLSPELTQSVVIRDTAKELLCPELGTIYKALSADASTNLGRSPALAIHDELGQVRGPRDAFYEAIDTAQGAHEHPLSIIISTQAPTDADLLSVIIDDALKGDDPTIKVALYTASEELDPFSDEAIKAANPAYGDFLNADECRRQAETARRMPSRESAYRNLILNQRVTAHNPFVSRSVWDACDGSPDEDVFREGPCFIGLDLSARNDLTALALVVKDKNGLWHARCDFFAPSFGVVDRASRDRAPYDVWAKDGVLTLTPGSSVEYGWVAERLIDLCDTYPVQAIAFDRWRIDVLLAELKRVGVELPMEPFGQGFKDMSPALEALETELLNTRLRHGGNPLLRWCAANAIAIRDPAGNRKLDKSKTTGRIDGLIALAMAMGKASTAMTEGNIVLDSDYQMMFV